MSLDKNSTVAELRTELERKRKRALDLQMNTTDMDEWKNLNAIRWELEDIDNDLYRSQFIKNNESLARLIDQIDSSVEDARKIVETLNNAKEVLQKARAELKNASAMFGELNNFYQETEELLAVIRK